MFIGKFTHLSKMGLPQPKQQERGMLPMLPRFSFASSILQPKHQPIYKSLSISGPFQSEPKSRNLFPVTSQPALFTSSCFLTIANCCLEKNFFGRFLNNSTICLSVPSFMPSFSLSGSSITFLIGSQPMNQPVRSSWKESGSDLKMTSISHQVVADHWSPLKMFLSAFHPFDNQVLKESREDH